MRNLLNWRSLQRTVFLAMVTALATPSFADAGVRACGEREKMAKFLASKYKENPRAVGVSGSGKAVLEVYTSQEGSWTVLMTTAKGVTCIMGAGHSWQDKDMAQYLPKS